jgi:hypothetical protein
MVQVGMVVAIARQIAGGGYVSVDGGGGRRPYISNETDVNSMLLFLFF